MELGADAGLSETVATCDAGQLSISPVRVRVLARDRSDLAGGGWTVVLTSRSVVHAYARDDRGVVTGEESAELRVAEGKIGMVSKTPPNLAARRRDRLRSTAPA